MARDWLTDPDVPTQSKTTSAPLVSRPAEHQRPAWRRTARASWSGAPRCRRRATGQLALMGVLGPDHHRAGRPAAPGGGGHHGEARASRLRPRPPCRPTPIPADSTAWTAQAVGSTTTASSSEKVSGTGVELGGMGGQAGGGPATPGVGAVPGLEPGSRAPKATLPHSPLCPLRTRAERTDVSGDAAQHRLDDRPGTGSQRCAVVVDAAAVEHPDHFVPGNEGEADHVLEVARARPSRVARSEPQIPESRGRRWNQSVPGSSG